MEDGRGKEIRQHKSVAGSRRLQDYLALPKKEVTKELTLPQQ